MVIERKRERERQERMLLDDKSVKREMSNVNSAHLYCWTGCTSLSGWGCRKTERRGETMLFSFILCGKEKINWSVGRTSEQEDVKDVVAMPTQVIIWNLRCSSAEKEQIAWTWEREEILNGKEFVSIKPPGIFLSLLSRIPRSSP